MTRLTLEAFPPGVREVLRVVHAMLGEAGRSWVVGGVVRDAVLGRRAEDLDLAVPAGALELGRAVADRLGRPFVVLDEMRGVGRVAGDPQLDLADFRGPDLAADLRGRDFTVNALAVAVFDLVVRGGGTIEDATGGLVDLAARMVRPCGEASLADDPVRVLRAARLAAEPGWSLDEAVEPAARAAAPRLREVSAERVRDELVAMLGTPASGRGLRLLERLGGVDAVLPESGPMRRTLQPAPHRFDVWEHSLRAVEAMDEIEGRIDGLAPWGGELREHLAEGLGDRVTRAIALKLAALLHDVAKPETRAEVGGRIRFIGHDKVGAERARDIAARLRLSRRATDVLTRLVAQHLRPMHLAQAGGISRRARYRFFRDLGGEARDLLLLSLADAAAVRGDAPLDVWREPAGAILRSLMDGMGEEARAAAMPLLLHGGDVMAALGLEPGPAVGRHLARIRQAQALGLLSTREEAMAYLHRTPVDTSEEGLLE